MDVSGETAKHFQVLDKLYYNLPADRSQSWNRLLQDPAARLTYQISLAIEEFKHELVERTVSDTLYAEQ